MHLDKTVYAFNTYRMSFGQDATCLSLLKSPALLQLQNGCLYSVVNAVKLYAYQKHYRYHSLSLG